MNYAFIGPSNEIVRTEPASKIDPDVETKSGWRWLPIVTQPAPAHAGNEAVSWAYIVGADAVTQKWAVSARAPAELTGLITAERDRRLSTFPFGGRSYQFDSESQVNVAGAGTLSLAAIIAGKLANDLRWADPDKDFAWLAADNTVVTMDAQTTLAFAQAAARWKADHIHAARAIKNLSPIPADYAANVRWPT